MKAAAPRDPAEMLFEPTGELAKDYSAYCEIEDKVEREDFLEGIQVEEVPDAPANVQKSRTNINIRNLEFCFNKRDAQPLTNAIPHCHNLAAVHLTGCGVTEYSYKQLVEAVYKSATVTSFAVDFNPNGLFKEPTATRKDKNEVFLFPSQYRGAHLKHAEADVKEADKKAGGGGGKPDAKKPAAAAAAAVPPPEAVEKPPVAVPAGFSGILYAGIQQLSLRGNGINDKQLEAFCPLLEQNPELLSLSLWGNSIGDDGAVQLAASIAKNRRLTALNVGHNKIGDVGLAAFAAMFKTLDVSNEEAHKARQKIYPGQELPAYPTFTDLALMSVQPAADEKRDPKKKEAPKGKAKAEGPIERLKGEFDKDVVRLDDHRLRIPGNNALWSLNLSHNMAITNDGVTGLAAMLASRPPVFDLKEVPPGEYVFPTPPPYVVGLALEHLVVEHPGLDAELLKGLQGALDANIAARKAAAAAAPA